MRKLFSFPGLCLLIALTAIVGTAQTSSTDAGAVARQLAPSSEVTTVAAHPNQEVINSLSNLPEADTLVYLNPQRILNEVLPKFMPAKDLEGMRKGFEEVKKNMGVDPTKVAYIVVAVRFRKPTADLNFQPPEVLVVTSGDFSADSLMMLARMASQGRLRDEKYGTKTLGLMTIDPIAKEAEKNPFLKAFSEVGVATLNVNTIAAGTPSYLRAAIDAAEGKDRISAAALGSLVRDPNALISVAGSPWQSFARSFGMLGTDANPRAARCETKMGDIYAALTMDDTNFMVRGTMNADNPDTAKILSNLYSGLLRYAAGSIPDASAQSVLKGFSINAEGDEVFLRADFPQQIVLDMIKKQMMKPKKDEAAATKPPAKPGTTRRRVRRRN
ncbi:MAG TPA: hypothetical protein VGW36_03895 [Pyrinomonadaceae bacterium]|nr:hypothetical protein [Pyrinomonadaceae bacterium]